MGLMCDSVSSGGRANSLEDVQPKHAVTRHYPRAPIAEAIIDMRVSGTGPNALGRFRDLSRDLRPDYPNESSIRKLEMGVQSEASGSPAAFHHSDDEVGLRLTSLIGDKAVQLQTSGLTVSQLPPYNNWLEFSSLARAVWPKYLEASSASRISRLGVRIINKIRIPQVKVDLEEWSKIYPNVPESIKEVRGFFIQTHIPLGFDHVYEGVSELQCVTNFLAGPRPTPESTELILDIDVFCVCDLNVENNKIWSVLDEISSSKNLIFEACITDKTRELFL